MKKILLTLTVVAFASALSVQAGGDACCAKTKTSAAAKSTCSASKTACSAGAKQAKSSAPATARGTQLAKN